MNTGQDVKNLTYNINPSPTNCLKPHDSVANSADKDQVYGLH